VFDQWTPYLEEPMLEKIVVIGLVLLAVVAMVILQRRSR
jgi:hypothetical protein